jgi:hypothetical protein
MPRTPAFKPIDFKFSRDSRPWHAQADTLVEAVAALDNAEGGDFSTQMKLTGDSLLIVERFEGSPSGARTRETRRFFPVTMLPSIAEYVAADVIPDVEMYA